MISCTFMLWLIVLLISEMGLLVGVWGHVGVCGVCGCVVGVGVRACKEGVFYWMLLNGLLSLVDMGVSEINRLVCNCC